MTIDKERGTSMTTITEGSNTLIIVHTNRASNSILWTFFLLCQIHSWAFALWGLYSYLFGVVGTAVLIFFVVITDKTPRKQIIILSVQKISIENIGKIFKRKINISYKDIRRINFKEELIRGGGNLGYITIETYKNTDSIIIIFYEGRAVYEAIKMFILKHAEEGKNVLEDRKEDRR